MLVWLCSTVIGTPDPFCFSHGALAWWSEPDPSYPFWVWRSLDAARPVRAWTAAPERVGLLPAAEMMGELVKLSAYRT